MTTTQLDSTDIVAAVEGTTEATTRNFYETIDTAETDAAPVVNSQLPVMIDNLREQAQMILNRVELIQRLNTFDSYKVLSKSTRNNLLHGLQDEIDTLEEIAKVAIRALKKVKRERISEEKVDELLEIPDYIRNAVNPEEETSDQ